MWVRTRRLNGHLIGPWHAETQINDDDPPTGRTWCGARLHKRTLDLERADDPSLSISRLCPECLRALSDGTPRTRRRRR